LEEKFKNNNAKSTKKFCEDSNIDNDLLEAAAEIKRETAQIDIIIHAIGILNALPIILDEDEIVESLSIGAGNTGKRFDLETNRRVAEFKFIRWQGGAESIRQNAIFCDFFKLITYKTKKKKQLFLIDLIHPKKFFNSRKSLNSVLSKNKSIQDEFKKLFKEKYQKVNEFYEDFKSEIELVDITKIMPKYKCLMVN